MSDSESSEEVEVKVEQQVEAKVKELIEKAKLILPAYSEDSLFNIYKQSFQNENVFLNKLQIIVKTQALANEENGEGWIQLKKHEKSTAPKRQHFEQNRPKRQRYNFLEDQKLIDRALKPKRDDDYKPREYQPKKHQQFRQKPVEAEQAYVEKKPVQKSEKVNQNIKKVQYKQKEEVAQAIKTQSPVKITPEPVEKKEVKPVKAYAEKKVKYAEKKQLPKNQPAIESVKEEPAQVHSQKPIQAPSAPVQQKKAEVQDAKLENTVVAGDIKPSSNKTQQASIVSDETIILIKPKIQPIPQNATLPKVENTPTESKVAGEVKSESVKRITSQRQIAVGPEVDKQFENSLSQNSFVLKFIKPTNKLQQVSYIRYPDGKLNDVKVKEPLDRKN